MDYEKQKGKRGKQHNHSSEQNSFQKQGELSDVDDGQPSDEASVHAPMIAPLPIRSPVLSPVEIHAAIMTPIPMIAIALLMLLTLGPLMEG